MSNDCQCKTCLRNPRNNHYLCLDYAILTNNFWLCRIQCCSFYHKSGTKVIIYKDFNSSLPLHCPSQFTTNTNHVPITNEMCSFADDSWSWRLVLCLCSCSSSKPQMTQYLFCVRATKHLFSIFYLSWIICWSTWIDKQLQWGTFHQKNMLSFHQNFLLQTYEMLPLHVDIYKCISKMLLFTVFKLILRNRLVDTYLLMLQQRG